MQMSQRSGRSLSKVWPSAWLTKRRRPELAKGPVTYMLFAVMPWLSRKCATAVLRPSWSDKLSSLRTTGASEREREQTSHLGLCMGT